MNIIADLPTTWQGWVELFVEILAATLLNTAAHPLGIAGLMAGLCLLVSAFVADMGLTNDDSPILTEEERETAR